NLTAKGLSNTLMTQADAEQRDFPAKVLNSRNRDTRFTWRAGTRTNDQILRLPSLNILQSHGIITDYFYFLLQFAKILDDVISKRVIVVDHEKHFEHNLLKFIYFITLREFVDHNVTHFV